MVDDELRPTPPFVTGAVSVGTAPLPFLAVYAALFLLHGSLRPVHPPDITGSQHGELLAGAIALLFFVLGTTSLIWFLNRRRRWPYAVFELAVLGGSIYFLVDETKGGTGVSVLLALTTIVSLALGFSPQGWHHMNRAVPGVVERTYASAGARVHPGSSPRDTVTAPAAQDSSAQGSSAPAAQGSSASGTSAPTAQVEPALLRRRWFPGRGRHDGEAPTSR